MLGKGGRLILKALFWPLASVRSAAFLAVLDPQGKYAIH